MEIATLTLASIYTLAKESGLVDYLKEQQKGFISGLIQKKAIDDAVCSQHLQQFFSPQVEKAFTKAFDGFKPTNQRLANKHEEFLLLFLDDARVKNAIADFENGIPAPQHVLRDVVQELFPEKDANKIAIELVNSLHETLARNQQIVNLVTLNLPAEIQANRSFLEDILQSLEELKAKAGISQTKIFSVPQLPPNFVGRIDQLAELKQHLIHNNSQSVSGKQIGIYGLTGVGKSYLAIRFAHLPEVYEQFAGIIYQFCGDAEIDAIVQDLAVMIKLDISKEEPQTALKKLKQTLQEKPYLLILDDVKNDTIEALIPGGKTSVVVTTQIRNLAMLSLHPFVEVKPFLEADALALIEKVLNKLTEAEEKLAKSISESLGYLPVAIAIVAGMIKESVRWDLSKISDLLNTNLPDAISKLKHHKRNLDLLFDTAINNLSNEEKKLLCAMAACSDEGFIATFAFEIADMSDEDSAYDSLQALTDRSLIRIQNTEEQRFFMHALTKAKVHTLPDYTTMPMAHSKLINERFEDWEKNWKKLLPQISEAIHAQQYLITQKETAIVWHITYNALSLCKRSGMLTEALRFLRNEQAYAEVLKDKDSLQRTYGNQAVILKAWGRLDEAMELHKKKEAICIELNNKDGLQATYGNQALILNAWGRLDEAMELHKKEEAICIELNNKEGLQATYGNQALILKAWGRLDEAMELHKKQEAICIELNNKDSLQISYGNQALILKAWGRLDEAMELHKKQEAICIELNNKEGLQATYGNQALILKAWGRLDEAMELHKKQEAICIELNNKEGLQATYGNQALILSAWGRLDEAMELHKKKEAICIELNNKDSLQISYGNQALILSDWGRLDEAMELHKKQEAICIELNNKEGLQATYGNQALILKAWGRLDEAMELHKKQEAICIELNNKDSLQISYGNQALILKAWGRLDEAMELHKKQEAICIELNNIFFLAICYANMALLHEEQENLTKAVEKMTAARDIFTQLKMPSQRESAENDLERITSKLP